MPHPLWCTGRPCSRQRSCGAGPGTLLRRPAQRKISAASSKVLAHARAKSQSDGKQLHACNWWVLKRRMETTPPARPSPVSPAHHPRPSTHLGSNEEGAPRAALQHPPRARGLLTAADGAQRAAGTAGTGVAERVEGGAAACGRPGQRAQQDRHPLNAACTPLRRLDAPGLWASRRRWRQAVGHSLSSSGSQPVQQPGGKGMAARVPSRLGEKAWQLAWPNLSNPTHLVASQAGQAAPQGQRQRLLAA